MEQVLGDAATPMCQAYLDLAIGNKAWHSEVQQSNLCSFFFVRFLGNSEQKHCDSDKSPILKSRKYTQV